MKAVAHTTRELASLADIELPKPAPGGRDLLVKVEAVSVNPVDTKRRIAESNASQPRVLGWDAAGTVAAVGDKVSFFLKEITSITPATSPAPAATASTTWSTSASSDANRRASTSRRPPRFH